MTHKLQSKRARGGGGARGGGSCSSGGGSGSSGSRSPSSGIRFRNTCTGQSIIRPSG